MAAPRVQFDLRSLFLGTLALASSLAVFGAWGFVWTGVAVGIVLLLRKADMACCTVSLLCAILVLLMFPFSGAPRRDDLMQCASQCGNIGLALRWHVENRGRFPSAWKSDAPNGPPRSWRVAVLPQWGRRDLYEGYDFAEPWNGPNNIQLSSVLLRHYLCGDRPLTGVYPQTDFVAVTGPETVWGDEEPLRPQEIGDGPGNTIAVIEIENSDFPGRSLAT